MALDLSKIDIDLIRAEQTRRSLKEFVKLFWGIINPATPFIDGWVIDCFCDHLAHLEDIRNILFNVNPGVSKSSIFSVFYPAWKFVHNPSTKVLYSSYALNLSERDSVHCRRLIGSDLYQRMFGNIYQVSKEVDTKRHFETTKMGFRQSISIGSATKGLKGNACILDDPHSASDADSDIKKKEAVTWFVDSWYDRLCDFSKDCRVVIGQRIAKDDLSQHILDNYKETWTHLVIPYEYKPTAFVSPIGWKDPRTEEGQPLWPARFPEAEIRQLKRNSRTYSAQWNQNPIDSENSLFKPCNFRHYKETETAYHCDGKRIAKADCWKLVAVDLAIATHNRADYTVFATAHVSRTGEIIVTDLFRDRLPGTKIVPRLVEYNAVHQPAYILIEDVAFQRMVLEQARQEGLAVRGIRPEADKESRSLPLQIRSEHWQLWFPQDAPWLSVAETELLEFPNGRHDDIVDALSMLAIEVGKRNRQRPEQPAEPKPETDEERMRKGLFADMR